MDLVSDVMNSLAVSVCDTSKLNFNGNYKCRGDTEKFSCQLICPPNTDPEVGFLPSYTCLYSEGWLIPAGIPQCRIGKFEIS